MKKTVTNKISDKNIGIKSNPKATIQSNTGLTTDNGIGTGSIKLAGLRYEINKSFIPIAATAATLVQVLPISNNTFKQYPAMGAGQSQPGTDSASNGIKPEEIILNVGETADNISSKDRLRVKSNHQPSVGSMKRRISPANDPPTKRSRIARLEVPYGHMAASKKVIQDTKVPNGMPTIKAAIVAPLTPQREKRTPVKKEMPDFELGFMKRSPRKSPQVPGGRFPRRASATALDSKSKIMVSSDPSIATSKSKRTSASNLEVAALPPPTNMPPRRSKGLKPVHSNAASELQKPRTAEKSRRSLKVNIPVPTPPKRNRGAGGRFSTGGIDIPNKVPAHRQSVPLKSNIKLSTVDGPKIKGASKVKGKVEEVKESEDEELAVAQYPATEVTLAINAPLEKDEHGTAINKQLNKMKKDLMYKLPAKKFHKSGFYSDDHKYSYADRPRHSNGSVECELIKKDVNESLISICESENNEPLKAVCEIVVAVTKPDATSTELPTVIEEVRPEMSSDTDGSISGKEGKSKEPTPTGSTSSAPINVLSSDDPPPGTYKSQKLLAVKDSSRRLMPFPNWWLHHVQASTKKKGKNGTQEIDYELPYDIHVWKFEQKGMKDVRNKYKKLKGNTYVDIKPYSDDITEDVCECKPPKDGEKGCGPDCWNRSVFVECDPKRCPCGILCSNQRMLKDQWAPGLERFMTANCGWGVRTTKEIKEGDFILEYIGEVCSSTLFQDRMANMYLNDSHHYCLSLGKDYVIDGYRAANEGRFVNHSCDPNCQMQKWSVNGYYRMGLFALRDIKPGEELSYDYNFDNYNVETQQLCRCGSDNCRGVIGGRSNRNERRASAEASKLKKGLKRGRKRIRKPAADKKDLPAPNTQESPNTVEEENQQKPDVESDEGTDVEIGTLPIGDCIQNEIDFHQ